MSFDVIAATCAALKKGLGIPASSTVPEKRPARFATVERTGGGYSLGKDSPNLAVQVWAETEAEAYALAIMAREVLLGMRENSVDQRARRALKKLAIQMKGADSNAESLESAF